MNSTTRYLKSLTCNVIGHKMKIDQVINDRITEYSCCNCGKKMTTNIYGQLVPFNDHYLRINRSLGQLARKKHVKHRVA